MRPRGLTYSLRSALLLTFAAVLAVLTAASCDIHEWPEDAPADVVLRLDFNTELPLYKEIELKTRGYDLSDYNIRYTIEAYRLLADGSHEATPTKKFMFSKSSLNDWNATFHIQIDEGDWLFAAWADRVLRSDGDINSASTFYDTENLTDVRLSGSYTGNTDAKDAFSGTEEHSVQRRSSKESIETIRISMNRPLAKYEFVATDYDDFMTKAIQSLVSKADPTDTKAPEVNLDDYNVILRYSGFLPSEFDVLDNRPFNAVTGTSFKSSIRPLSGNEAVIGFDYVMVNGIESSVMVVVELYDKNNELLSRTNPLEIPLKRSHLTKVKGRFLTQEAGDGVVVDPRYDGEFNIFL